MFLVAIFNNLFDPNGCAVVNKHGNRLWRNNQIH